MSWLPMVSLLSRELRWVGEHGGTTDWKDEMLPWYNLNDVKANLRLRNNRVFGLSRQQRGAGEGWRGSVCAGGRKIDAD